MTEKDLHVRLSTEEMKMLSRYCQKTKRTKTDVIRELVRLLPVLGASNPPKVKNYLSQLFELTNMENPNQQGKALPPT
ncbi:hypothetical protein [Gloeothece verrucosa]|uniref:CopG domain protein DNA-binding domain protein n=1 Tax=Gloeothece verrucosa (strain PCC 7822) TaxID=497965 RepID=E0U9U7_GLOV7|nr:hypothetical protein [Gloeothece verrucosa]ADN15017.1 hypothetical protein Cyan7822_3062 [Gloeothece verrucosa PCC 7822]